MIVSPALRVGAVIARGPVRERILAEHTPQAHVEHAPPGGVNLGARLPGGVDVLQLAQDCERAGVVIAAGTERFPADPTGPYIRLNYSETDPASFLRGARVLGGALGHAQG